MTSFKVTFTLDEEDVAYFRSRYRAAKRETKSHDPGEVIVNARRLVSDVHANAKAPRFVVDAIDVLSDLTEIIQDENYRAPKRVRDAVLAGLAYFVNPDDLVPDQIPGLGFLDDAIMIKFVEEEFKNELWGYRKFRKLRDSTEQRPWSDVAQERLAKRLASDRKKIRAAIEDRDAKDATRRKSGSYLGW
ncbi:DUF1232 domain-containing protein [Myxococcota bacterium]|nr:DUF1232 domain-containing protein [Myxococcota bacterium]